MAGPPQAASTGAEGAAARPPSDRCAATGVASPSTAARAVASHDICSGVDSHFRMSDASTSRLCPLSPVFDRWPGDPRTGYARDGRRERCAPNEPDILEVTP